MNENLKKALRTARKYNTEQKDEMDTSGKNGGGKIGVITTDYYRLMELPSVGLRIPQKMLKHVKEVPAKGKWPAYLLIELEGIRIHICDGLRPDAEGRVAGRLEFNVRVSNTSREGGVEVVNLNMSILPAAQPIEGKPKTLVTCWNGREDQTPPFHYDDRYGPDDKNGNVLLTAL